MAPSDFKYLLLKYGKEGARSKFEEACEKALKAENSDAFAVEANPGDEGIDVFVGDFNQKIKVYQCKFFIDNLGESQKKQIRESFHSCIQSSEYDLDNWYLCLPKKLDIKETKWWHRWKSKTEKAHPNVQIHLMDSTSLLTLIRKNKVDEDIFDLEELKLLREIHEHLIKEEEVIKEVLSLPPDLDYEESTFRGKLLSAHISEGIEICEKQFYNAEILEREILSKDITSETKEMYSLKDNIQDLWYTQFLKNANSADGNKLLGAVNERIEHEHKNILRTKIEVSVNQKKGMMHQLADECQIGWVKNYKKRLEEYIKSKNGD